MRKRECLFRRREQMKISAKDQRGGKFDAPVVQLVLGFESRTSSLLAFSRAYAARPRRICTTTLWSGRLLGLEARKAMVARSACREWFPTFLGSPNVA